jgi:hypothetical protein
MSARMKQVTLSLALSIGSAVAFQAPACSEEYRGTIAQQLACTPDVLRFCGEQMPDVNRIVACLRQNTPLLSGSCRAVFESNADTSQGVAAGRDDPSRPYNAR